MRAPQHSIPQTARQTARARAAFLAWRGTEGDAERAAAIAALPTVVWRGHTLYSLTCCAEYGKGPHVVNVPEAVLWALIDLRMFRCPWHRT